MSDAKSTQLQFTADVAITAGMAVSINPSTGNVIPHSNTAGTPAPCIGVAISTVPAGFPVTVQVSSTLIVQNLLGVVIPSGHFCGDQDGTGRLADMGSSLTAGSTPESAAGIVFMSTTSVISLLVHPQYVSIKGAVPTPSASTLGGVFSDAPVAHEWVKNIATTGHQVLAQPDQTDISNLGIKQNTVTLTSAQIKNLTATPVALIPAVAGHYFLPVAIVLELLYVSPAYVNTTPQNFTVISDSSGIDTYFLIPDGFMTNSSNWISRNAISLSSNNEPTGGVAGQTVLLGTDGSGTDLTTGNGTLKVTVYYHDFVV